MQAHPPTSGVNPQQSTGYQQVQQTWVQWYWGQPRYAPPYNPDTDPWHPEGHSGDMTPNQDLPTWARLGHMGWTMALFSRYLLSFVSV